MTLTDVLDTRGSFLGHAESSPAGGSTANCKSKKGSVTFEKFRLLRFQLAFVSLYTQQVFSLGFGSLGVEVCFHVKVNILFLSC